LVPSLTGICQVIHGDFTQATRDTTMNAFRDNHFQVLVATDVAARGLDIEGVDLIIQTSPPRNGYEQYIHRSGRTGRAGKEGTCVTLVSNKNKASLKEIQEKAKVNIIWVKEPGPQALYEAAGKRTITFIKKVEPAIISHFIPLSTALVEDFNGDMTRALAAALACASGFAHQRSLLGRLFNYETILIQDAPDLNRFSLPAIKQFILSLVPSEERNRANAVGLIRKTTNGQLVADVPGELLPHLLEHSKKDDKKAVITKISELPPLQNIESWGPPRGDWGARSGGGGGGRGGGGRGGGRGGRGGQGSWGGGGGGGRSGRGGGGGGGSDRSRWGGGGGGGRFGRGGGGGRDGRGRSGRGEGARGRGMMKKFSWSE